MKRLICVFLALLLLLPLTGCGESEPQMPGNFYYRRAETAFGTLDAVIAPEARAFSGSTEDLDALFEAYLDGPESGDLVSPFPRDAEITAWEIRSTLLVLTVNDAFAAMSGVELTIACACVTRTLTEILPISHVRFQTGDGLIGGEKSLTFSMDSLRLTDDSLDQARAVYSVYYADQDRRYLIAQDISVNLATESDVIGYLLDALLTPPENSGLLSPIPRNTKLLGYGVDDGLCTVNFSGEFERNRWKLCEAQRLTLMSVVNTLTQLEEIQQVEFRVDGNLLVQYGMMNISAPLEFEEGVIGPVRTGMNEFDATLYLANGGGYYLASVPTRIRQTGGLSEAELVVEALLAHTPRNGFYSTIPEGTTLNSIQFLSGVCMLDLSGEFLSSTGHLIQSVHSIVASVCATGEATSVRITVDGATPEGDFGDLFSTLSPKSDWFL